MNGEIPAGAPLPSSRKLARRLAVSRNTVSATYHQLVAEGFLESRERSGFYVTDDVPTRPAACPVPHLRQGARLSWDRRLAVVPSRHRSVVKAADWYTYPFPFVYNQLDSEQFPVAAWRECSRLALAVDEIQNWASDRIAEDDPLLIEQIRTRLLPPRGIHATPDEVLVTVGAQQALYLIARLLVTARTTVGLEDPGYPDMRNICALSTEKFILLEVDEQGLIPSQRLEGCDILYTTPSYQFPTTGTMPHERRLDLLESARDCVIIEDDYECEVRYENAANPSLKSLDQRDQVLYVASLSKTFTPGLRMGFMVGPAEFIQEARALRRLMLRHPPANNQRTTALFLQRGYHERLLRHLSKVYRERQDLMSQILAQELKGCSWQSRPGSSGFWIRCPKGLDTMVLEEMARRNGVLIEPGCYYFFCNRPPENYMRLAFSSIATDKIEPGLRKLGHLYRSLVGISANCGGDSVPS